MVVARSCRRRDARCLSHGGSRQAHAWCFGARRPSVDWRPRRNISRSRRCVVGPRRHDRCCHAGNARPHHGAADGTGSPTRSYSDCSSSTRHVCSAPGVIAASAQRSKSLTSGAKTNHNAPNIAKPAAATRPTISAQRKARASLYFALQPTAIEPSTSEMIASGAVAKRAGRAIRFAAKVSASANQNPMVMLRRGSGISQRASRTG